MKTFKKIFDLLSHRERRQVFYLLMMILFMALLDVIGIASIMPFIAVLTNPDLIQNNILINKLYNYSNLFGVKTNEQFLFSLGVLVFFLLVFSLAFKALLAYSQLRFSSMCKYGLSKRMMERYLNQPYSWFLSRHSAEIGKTVLSEVGIIVTKGLKPILNIITHGTVAFAILVLLIINEPKFSLIACSSLSLTYFLIYRLTRNFLMRIGQARVKANQDQFMVVTEAFNAAKELKVGNLEKAFLERFSFPAKTLANILKRYSRANFIWCQEEPKNMGAWNTVRNYIDRTLEIINFGDKSVKYVGRKAASSTATGNLNKHLAQQKEILEKILKD